MWLFRLEVLFGGVGRFEGLPRIQVVQVLGISDSDLSSLNLGESNCYS